VVINSEGEVLQSSGRTGKYLELPPGTPDHNVYGMARRGLRLDLRAAVHKVLATGQPVTQSNIEFGTNGGRQTIDLHVQPLTQPTTQETLCLVVFQDVGGVSLTAKAEPADDAGKESVTVKQLENELRATKERLQTTTEELESSNEELKSGNEELSSMNEELQSANEELETSKEELQSINEELQTVNAELGARVDELGRLNSDIANLLESTQIATVFLDQHLHVKSFTPAAKDLFRLVESDTGRPLTHVRARFHAEKLQEDCERVLRTLSTIERQVALTDGDARYILRILPYRSVDNVIGGVVLTFTDVTRQTAAEAKVDELARALRHRVENLEKLLDLIPVGVLIAEDGASDKILVNRHGCRILGEGMDGTGMRLLSARMKLDVGGRELPAEAQPLQQAIRTGNEVATIEARLSRRDGTQINVLVRAIPLFEEGGRTRGAIAAIVDLADRDHAAEKDR
jgi:two-component system, chemotaxis family, CheB/CheR fusion protein